jgi:hypothetical protein
MFTDDEVEKASTDFQKSNSKIPPGPTNGLVISGVEFKLSQNKKRTPTFTVVISKAGHKDFKHKIYPIINYEMGDTDAAPTCNLEKTKEQMVRVYKDLATAFPDSGVNVETMKRHGAKFMEKSTLFYELFEQMLNKLINVPFSAVIKHKAVPFVDRGPGGIMTKEPSINYMVEIYYFLPPTNDAELSTLKVDKSKIVVAMGDYESKIYNEAMAEWKKTEAASKASAPQRPKDDFEFEIPNTASSGSFDDDLPF